MVRAMARNLTATLRLDPIRHEEPSCKDYRDPQEVIRFEREVRLHRAFVEPYVITRLSNRVDGDYRVEGSGRQGHLVDIVDATGRHDACGCPDFLTNELGVCKHIAAVRRALHADRARWRALMELGAKPPQPTLTVDGTGGLALRAVGPRASRLAADLALAADSEGRLSPRDGYDATEEFALHTASRKTLLMETFYREQRRKHDILMDGDKPAGGAWNFDTENPSKYSVSMRAGYSVRTNSRRKGMLKPAPALSCLRTSRSCRRCSR